MTVTDWDILVVAIPLRWTVSHALADRAVARNLLVRVVDDDGREGWGECCPRPYVTGETIESTLRDAAAFLHEVSTRRFESVQDVARYAEAVLDDAPRQRHAAFCAVELALLDLVGKRAGTSAGTVIGSICSEIVEYSGIIATTDLEAVARHAGLLGRHGASRIKIKVDGDLAHNVRILERVRAIVGEEVELRIDANCSWTAADAERHVEALSRFRIRAVEQPVAESDIATLASLTREFPDVAVVVDESLCTIDDARRLAEAGACDVFNVRISKCGGLANARRVHDVARRHGISCQLGAQVGETGILSAAGRHFCTRLEAIRWCEGSFGAHLLVEDIVDPDVSIEDGGRAPALTDPGLGVNVRHEVVARWTESRVTSGARRREHDRGSDG